MKIQGNQIKLNLFESFIKYISDRTNFFKDSKVVISSAFRLNESATKINSKQQKNAFLQKGLQVLQGIKRSDPKAVTHAVNKLIDDEERFQQGVDEERFQQGVEDLPMIEPEVTEKKVRPNTDPRQQLKEDTNKILDKLSSKKDSPGLQKNIQDLRAEMTEAKTREQWQKILDKAKGLELFKDL